MQTLSFHSIPLQLRPEHRYFLRRSSRIWLDYAAKASFECPGKWPRCSSTSDASPSLWPKYDMAQLHFLAKKKAVFNTYTCLQFYTMPLFQLPKVLDSEIKNKDFQSIIINFLFCVSAYSNLRLTVMLK